MDQQHGLLVVNKPQGVTSAKCTHLLKRLGQKKIGHAGTLDPMAQGVLLILLGHGTKIFGHLLSGGQKTYKGTIRFGQTTDTWDLEGQIISNIACDYLCPEEVAKAIYSWKDISYQRVPPYSAVKYQGRPLYLFSREGKDVPYKTKKVEISYVEVINISLPFASFRVTCSSGTYIRSLAHSLGMRMGCGAVLTELIREYSYPFGLDAAIPFEELLNNPELLPDRTVPITTALPHWSKLIVTEEEARLIRNGVPLVRKNVECLPGEKTMLLLQDGTPLALSETARSVSGTIWIILRGLWN